MNSAKNTHIPALSAGILVLVALLLIFGPLLHLLGVNPVYAHLHVFHRAFVAASVVSLPSVGVMLLYMAIFVYQRRILAAITSSWLILLLVFYLFLLYPYGRLTLPILVLAVFYYMLIATNYKQFTMRNSFAGIMPHLIPVGTIAGIGFLYGIVGFFFFSSVLFHTHLSFTTSIKLTLDSLTVFSGTITEPTRAGQLFIDSLGGIGIVTFILLLNALFRPLQMRLFSHQQINLRKASDIVMRRSRSSEDFFKLWPEDKQYYFSSGDGSFIAYKPSGRTIVVLGDPVGRSKEFPLLVQRFVAYCSSLGWSIAVINASPIGRRLYEKHGLSSLFIGNEGIVAVEQFQREVRTNKHFRYVANKAARDGLSVEIWDTVSNDQLAELRAISRNWLARGRREYTFFMGYFDTKYLRQCRIFVLLQHGKPVAYTNLIPRYYKTHESLDHLRSMATVSSVGMHFLLLRLLETLHGEGAKTLNIGLAPLSGIKESEADLLPRAVLRIVRLLGASYYSFQGLEQFKSKFKPQWVKQSVVYSGNTAGLLGIARDIERASAFDHRGNRDVIMTASIGVVVLTIGLYVILA